MTSKFLAISVAAAATIAALVPMPDRATEARLIGLCHGRIMAAMEEDHFPAGCDWIEAVRYETGR